MPSARQAAWSSLLLEPLALTLAVVSIALAYTVVLRPPETNAADFYTFWDSARIYRDGFDPYLAQAPRYGLGYNLNVPASIVLFLPFSVFDLVPAFIAWTTMSVGLFAYVGWRVAVVAGYERWLLVVCALFISQAIFSSLQLGQLTAILAVVFTEAWIADRQDRPLVSGALLGIAIGLKPFLAPFVIYALWRRSMPLVVGLAAGVTTICLIGLLLMGVSGYVSWYEVLQRVTWSGHLTNGSLLAALQRIFTTIPDLSVTPLTLRENWVSPLWWMLVATVGLVGVLAIGRDEDKDRAWLTITLGSLLMSPLGWAYYVPLAAGPLAGYLRRASPRVRSVAAAGYAFLCVPYTVMNLPYGVVLSLIVASASTWGILGLYAAAISGASAARE